jgi:hypothetical protein
MDLGAEMEMVKRVVTDREKGTGQDLAMKTVLVMGTVTLMVMEIAIMLVMVLVVAVVEEVGMGLLTLEGGIGSRCIFFMKTQLINDFKGLMAGDSPYLFEDAIAISSGRGYEDGDGYGYGWGDGDGDAWGESDCKGSGDGSGIGMWKGSGWGLGAANGAGTGEGYCDRC